jgi:hypothetical protein
MAQIIMDHVASGCFRDQFGYLTGHYVCEQCDQHFDRPPIKPGQDLKQESQ